MTRAPLRFLIAVLALWVGVRAAVLLPGWPGGLIPVPAAAAAEAAPTSPPTMTPTAFPPVIAPSPAAAPRLATRIPPVTGQSAGPDNPARMAAPPTVSLAFALPARKRSLLVGLHIALPREPVAPEVPAFGIAPRPVHFDRSRWSASAWLLVRDEGGTALAPGGTLGGSQAGARTTYTLGGGFALSGRAYLPLRQIGGAELAAGIDWRPVRSIPVSLVAERRERLGRDGRSAFALTAYGGASAALTPHVRLDGYGQAGIVGLRSRDLFVDGSIRVSRRLGPVEFGAAVWGAAQPGAARLDAGPSLSLRLPVPDTNLRLQADWRFRVAGHATPGSGPALTLAADF
jgi:hypothetical protein